MSWTIYCHTHMETQRRYIGLTKQTMERRWASHISKSKSAKGGRWHFPNAIKKHGPDAFSHEVLEICDTLELANERESYWINLHKTRDPKFGFNLAEGGQHKPHPIRKNPWDNPEYRAKSAPRFAQAGQTAEARAANKLALNTPESKNRRSAASKEMRSRPEVVAKMAAAAAEFSAKYEASQETRKKLSKAGKKRTASQETRKKLREVMLNRPSELRQKAVGWGRSHSAETKAKIGAALKGRKLSEAHRAKLSKVARRS